MDTVITVLPTPDRLWFFEIVVGVLVLLAVNYLFKRIVKHVRHRSISTSPDWKEKIDQILFPPFQILLWMLGATLVLKYWAGASVFLFLKVTSMRSADGICALRRLGVAALENGDSERNFK